jgi:hypothetical protein
MSVCVNSVFVLFFVSPEALGRADLLSKETYRMCRDYETEEVAKAQGRAVEP